MPAEDVALPTTRADLDALVTWSVIRAARRFEYVLADRLAPFELTPVQFGALAHLAVEPFLIQAELAHRILMRPQSVHHLLDVLIGRGLVERTAERGSGRRNPVRLTAAGRTLLTQAWPVVVVANAPASLGLTAQQHERLAAVVAQVLRDDDTDGDRHGTGTRQQPPS